MATQKPGPKPDTKFKTPEGVEVKVSYQADAMTEGRHDVVVNGAVVGYVYEGDNGWDSFIDPAQEGSGFGAPRNLVSGAKTRKEAVQALADALGKHADVNVLSR